MKTKEELNMMISLVETALGDLPDFDAFGESNQENREEMELWLSQLEDVRDHQIVPKEGTEVRYWLDGNAHSALNAFKE
jgi:hypothetical protein